MRRILALLICLGILILSAGSVSAEDSITTKKMEKLGIEYKLFTLGVLSENGQTFLGIERTNDLQKKVKGLVYSLKVFKFKNGKIDTVKSIDLPLTYFQQIAINEDGSKAFIIGNSGLKYLLLDVPDGKVKVLFEHKKGSPGFNAGDAVVAIYYKEAFYCLGYFYDQYYHDLGDFMVKVDTGKTGIGIFEKVLDMNAVEKQIGWVKAFAFCCPSKGFFVSQPGYKGPFYVKAYVEGKVLNLDSGAALGGIASCDNRVLYAIKRENLDRELILKDIDQNKTWSIGEKNKLYTYIFVSGNGKTVVASLIADNGFMTMYYGRESDNFKLKPIKELTDVGMGTFRLSNDGNWYMFFNKSGLRYGELK